MTSTSALLLTLLVACSASAPRPTGGGRVPADAGVEPDPMGARRDAAVPTPRDAAIPSTLALDAAAPAACPGTFAQATGRACGGAPDACTYPQGTCQCGAVAWCGGAAPPPGYGRELTWQCTPRVRGDGCPGELPSGACARDGQVCDYTCSCVLTATCAGGTWQTRSGPCKPSAAPRGRPPDDGGE